MVDKPKFDQMLANLKTYCTELRELSSTPRETFLGDKHRLGCAKYHFVVAIECCIDIANHIVSSENYRFPASNADSFVVLVENGILPEAMRNPMRAMARFRNRLVHLYWEVEDNLVYDYLHDSMTDLDAFAAAVAAFASGSPL